MKALLVGEMPSRSGDRYHAFPLSGAVAQTLCQMAEIAPQPDGSRYGRWTWALYDSFDCVNAIERHQSWSSRVGARHLLETFAEASGEYEVVVLCGRRAQEAYVAMTEPAKSNVEGLPFYRWRVDLLAPTARREVVVIPHPSARNRTYNDPQHRQRAGQVLREAIEKAKQLEETTL